MQRIRTSATSSIPNDGTDTVKCQRNELWNTESQRRGEGCVHFQNLQSFFDSSHEFKKKKPTRSSTSEKAKTKTLR